METETAGATVETPEASSQPAVQQPTPAGGKGPEGVPAQESAEGQPGANQKPPESSYVTKDELKTALAEALEQGKRLGQSSSDKYTRKVEGQNKGLQARLAAAEKRLREVDPDGADKLELEYHKARESEERLTAEQQRIADEFFGEFREDAKERGINPDDPRIDWGTDAPSIAAQTRRINASFRKIEKEDAEKKAKAVETPKAESKPAVKPANSVSTTQPSGTGLHSDAEFKKGWGSGDLPNTPENMKRARQLLNT